MNPPELVNPISGYSSFYISRNGIFGFSILKIYSFFICLFSWNIMIAQKNRAGLEMETFARKDWYPWIRYDRPAGVTDSISMTGVSFGVAISYHFPLARGFIFKGGLGYFKYRFDNIVKIHPLFGASASRMINYPSPNYIVFTTDRYEYNTFMISTAIERPVKINGELDLIFGLIANNYFTFSQSYHIDASSVLGPVNGHYRTNDFRYFGASTNLYISLSKSIRGVQLRPSLLIPLLDVWKQDDIFPGEISKLARSKTARGIGLGMTVFVPVTLQLK